MATKKQCTTCPTCGSKVELKAKAKAKAKNEVALLKSKDFIVLDNKIFWKIEDEMTDMGAAVGEGRSMALSKRIWSTNEDKQFIAVELVATSLASKLNAEFRLGSWRYPSENAANKAKRAIIEGANMLISSGNWEQARQEARAAEKTREDE